MTLKEEFKSVYKNCKEFFEKLNEVKYDLREVDTASNFKDLLSFRTFREIYLSLIETAIERRKITFAEFAKKVNEKLGEPVLPEKGNWLGTSLGTILGFISLYEYSMGRPLLSALVVRADSGSPGNGFYSLGNALGFKVSAKVERMRSYITWGGYAKN